MKPSVHERLVKRLPVERAPEDGHVLRRAVLEPDTLLGFHGDALGQAAAGTAGGGAAGADAAVAAAAADPRVLCARAAERDPHAKKKGAKRKWLHQGISLRQQMVPGCWGSIAPVTVPPTAVQVTGV